MGVITVTNDVPCSVAPARLFKAFFVDCHNLMPKVASNGLQVDNVNHETRSVKHIDFSDEKYGNERVKVDIVDEANFVGKYTMSGFNHAGTANKYESVICVFKCEPTSDGGCIVKGTYTFTGKGDAVPREDEINEVIAVKTGLIKSVETHLAQQPQVYAN